MTIAVVAAAETQVEVLERGSRTPISGATLVLETGEHSTTDQTGRALLPRAALPSAARILASGYESLRIDLTPGDQISVYLMPQPYRLQGLEAVADRLHERTSRVALSRKEITAAPGTAGDPINTVHALPGVEPAGEASGLMSMRGSDLGDNRIRINGIRVPYLFHFGGYRSTVNPVLVSDFSVYSAGFPVDYGDGLGGAIDIQLRDPHRDRLRQTWNIGTHETSVLIEGPVPGLEHDAFQIGARRSYLDWLISPQRMNRALGSDDDDDAVITVPRYYDAQATWHRQLADGNVTFRFMSVGDELGMDARSMRRTEPALAGELGVTMGYDLVGLNWQSQLSDQWRQHTALSYSDYREDIFFGSDETGEPFHSDLRLRTLRAQPELQWRGSDRTRVTVGAEFEHLDSPIDLYMAAPPALGDNDWNYTDADRHRVRRNVQATTAAPFVKHSTTIGKLTTHLGLRYTHARGSDGIAQAGLSPRIGAEYRLTSRDTISASWGRYRQPPASVYLLDGIGNPALDSMAAEHRVIGWERELAPDWQAKVEAYQKPMRGLIVATDAPPPGTYVNQGSGDAYGVDVLIRRTPREGRSGWLSYSYAHSARENELTGERFDFDGNRPHSLTLMWTQPMPWRHWRWGLRVEVASGQPYTPIVGRRLPTPDDDRYRPVYGDTNSARLPMYFRADLRIDRTFRFQRWMMSLYLDLHNVTFHRNVVRYDHGRYYERYDNPREVRGMPFMPFFGLEASF